MMSNGKSQTTTAWRQYGELHLHAPDRREAILCGLELLGPHAHLIRCSLLEQWA